MFRKLFRRLSNVSHVKFTNFRAQIIRNAKGEKKEKQLKHGSRNDQGSPITQ